MEPSALKLISLQVLIFQFMMTKKEINLIWVRVFFNKQIKHRRNQWCYFFFGLICDLCATSWSAFYGLDNTN